MMYELSLPILTLAAKLESPKLRRFRIHPGGESGTATDVAADFPFFVESGGEAEGGVRAGDHFPQFFHRFFGIEDGVEILSRGEVGEQGLRCRK